MVTASRLSRGRVVGYNCLSLWGSAFADVDMNVSRMAKVLLREPRFYKTRRESWAPAVAAVGVVGEKRDRDGDRSEAA